MKLLLFVVCAVGVGVGVGCSEEAPVPYPDYDSAEAGYEELGAQVAQECVADADCASTCQDVGRIKVYCSETCHYKCNLRVKFGSVEECKQARQNGQVVDVDCSSSDWEHELLFCQTHCVGGCVGSVEWESYRTWTEYR